MLLIIMGVINPQTFKQRESGQAMRQAAKVSGTILFKFVEETTVPIME